MTEVGIILTTKTQAIPDNGTCLIIFRKIARLIDGQLQLNPIIVREIILRDKFWQRVRERRDRVTLD
jgi:hypothetical protein